MPEITLPAPTSVPPTVAEPPEIDIPKPFAMPAVPAALRPIKFPCIRVALPPTTAIPTPLTEITFRVPGVVPPMRLLFPARIDTPTPEEPKLGAIFERSEERRVGKEC